MATNQIKGGAILSYLSIIIGNVIVLIYTPFMLRCLGSSEYGIYSICNTVSSAIAMLDSGFGIAAVRFIVKNKNDKSILPDVLGTLTIINIFLGVVAMLIMGAVAMNTDRIFGNSMTVSELASVRVILWIAGAYLSISFMSSIFPAIVVAHERFIFVKVVDIIKSIMLPLLIVPFLLAGFKAIAMSLITVIVFLMMNVAKLIYCYTKLRVTISFKHFDFALLKQALPFVGLVIFKLLLDRVYWSGGQFILGIVSGTTAVAIMALALQLSGYYNSIALSINNLFLPKCTSLVENNDFTGISDLFSRVSRTQLFMLGIFICVFVVFGNLFVKLWAGDTYSDAYYCCLLIMIPYTVPLSQGIVNSILQAQNKLSFQALVFSIINIVVVVLSFYLGKYFGAIGCSLTISLCIVIGEILIMNLFYKRLSINISEYWINFFKILFPLFIISLIFNFIFNYFSTNNWISFISGVLILSSILLSISYFCLMNTFEKSQIKKMISVFKR